MGVKGPQRLLLAGLYLALTLAASTGVVLQMYLMQVQNPSLRADLCQASGEERPPEHSPLCGLQVASGALVLEEPAPPSPLEVLWVRPTPHKGYPQPPAALFAPRAPPAAQTGKAAYGSGFGRREVVRLQVVLYTKEIELYALVFAALEGRGIRVSLMGGSGIRLADLEHMELGQRVIWRTPAGVRAWDPRSWTFLTRRDDPQTLAEGLMGRGGLGLRPGERAVFRAVGALGTLRTFPLAQATGLEGYQVRYHLRGLRNKFGLSDLDFLRLARYSLRLAGHGTAPLEEGGRALRAGVGP
ncbi:hypothetical protein [Thermus sediminis]|uniref:hypothetical protein n=1 Tax=Thermus sediminis TaxID=1761908 RepID=UPI001E2DEFB3|nr:hypothetical protein [Thermus sediminis]